MSAAMNWRQVRRSPSRSPLAKVDEVELVHLAAVHAQYSSGKTVIDVMGIAVGGPAHRHNLSVGEDALFSAVRRIEGAEHVVVRAVFLDDEDDVINFLNVSRSALPGSSDWDCRKHKEDADFGAKTREPHEGHSWKSIAVG
jgi:hypothetical protein